MQVSVNTPQILTIFTEMSVNDIIVRTRKYNKLNWEFASLSRVHEFIDLNVVFWTPDSTESVFLCHERSVFFDRDGIGIECLQIRMREKLVHGKSQWHEQSDEEREEDAEGTFFYEPQDH